jgi:hypothetical protein
MNSVYTDIANSHPSLKSGDVWCRECGAKKNIKSSNALKNGYPKCCGYTMTIDNPSKW